MRFLLIFGTLFLLVSCNSNDTNLQTKVAELEAKLAATEKVLAESKPEKIEFIHTVFFWMKDGVTDEQKKTFADKGLMALSKISSISQFYYGPPAMTPREVVDNSYDFALVCHFKDQAAHDAYQDDPIHLKFIEDFKDLWEKVQVYDNLDQYN